MKKPKMLSRLSSGVAKTVLCVAPILAPIAVTLTGPNQCLAQSRQDRFEMATLRAHKFLFTEQRAKEILNYVHFLTDYRDLHLLKVAALPYDRVALIYRFSWNDDGWTDIQFNCDADGYVYDLEVNGTDAEFNEPFFLANLSIQVLGNALIEQYRDQLSPEDLKLVRRIVRNADAKSLLVWQLKLDQLAGN